MKITPNLFHAYLKCPTKCWLRATGEEAPGNGYAEWVKAQNDTYRNTEAQRLVAEASNAEVAMSPEADNLKSAKWQLATGLIARAPGSSFTLESTLHAIERIPSTGRGKAVQFIPIHFIFTNKLSKDDKLRLAFDALVFSGILGREIRFGKIIHGDDHATLKVKTLALFGEVRKRIDKISMLLSSTVPPDLVLNPHCSECEFQAGCRQKAVEKDDLSLLARMTSDERRGYSSKGIFTVTQLSYTFRPRRRPKKLRDKPEKYHHPLKALAIRDKRIYVVGTPALRSCLVKIP